MKMFSFTLVQLVLACTCGIVGAQDKSDILIGISLPLSGPNAGAGQEGFAVAKAYIESVNKAGGIGGRRVVLSELDDGFDPARSAQNARKLIDSGAVAMFNCWGTSSCSAIMPVIAEARIPLVSGISGGGPMRQAPGKYAFNVRPSTEHEVGRMVKQMASVGQTDIAVVYQDDPFGKSGQAAARNVLSAAGLKPALEIAVAPGGLNAETVVDALRKLPRLNGIILLASPPTTVKLIPHARKVGLATQFYNLAAQANQKVASELGAATDGVVFTTVAPSPWKDGIPVVKEYQQLYTAATGKTTYSYLGMEVFINAKVLVEGLRKAGPSVNRESLTQALEAMGEKRFGPVSVSYGPGKRDGSHYVGLTIISRDGKFLE